MQYLDLVPTAVRDSPQWTAESPIAVLQSESCTLPEFGSSTAFVSYSRGRDAGGGAGGDGIVGLFYIIRRPARGGGSQRFQLQKFLYRFVDSEGGHVAGRVLQGAQDSEVLRLARWWFDALAPDARGQFVMEADHVRVAVLQFPRLPSQRDGKVPVASVFVHEAKKAVVVVGDVRGPGDPPGGRGAQKLFDAVKRARVSWDVVLDWYKPAMDLACLVDASELHPHESIGESIGAGDASPTSGCDPTHVRRSRGTMSVDDAAASFSVVFDLASESSPGGNEVIEGFLTGTEAEADEPKEEGVGASCDVPLPAVATLEVEMPHAGPGCEEWAEALVYDEGEGRTGPLHEYKARDAFGARFRVVLVDSGNRDDAVANGLVTGESCIGAATTQDAEERTIVVDVAQQPGFDARRELLPSLPAHVSELEVLAACTFSLPAAEATLTFDGKAVVVSTRLTVATCSDEEEGEGEEGGEGAEADAWAALPGSVVLADGTAVPVWKERRVVIPARTDADVSLERDFVLTHAHDKLFDDHSSLVALFAAGGDLWAAVVAKGLIPEGEAELPRSVSACGRAVRLHVISGYHRPCAGRPRFGRFDPLVPSVAIGLRGQGAMATVGGIWHQRDMGAAFAATTGHRAFGRSKGQVVVQPADGDREALVAMEVLDRYPEIRAAHRRVRPPCSESEFIRRCADSDARASFEAAIAMRPIDIGRLVHVDRDWKCVSIDDGVLHLAADVAVVGLAPHVVTDARALPEPPEADDLPVPDPYRLVAVPACELLRERIPVWKRGCVTGSTVGETGWLSSEVVAARFLREGRAGPLLLARLPVKVGDSGAWVYESVESNARLVGAVSGQLLVDGVPVAAATITAAAAWWPQLRDQSYAAI